MAKNTRLDKVFSNLGILTRSECKKAVKRKEITVNGEIVKDSDYKVDPEMDEIAYLGEVLDTRTFVYYMLNKPEGYITANEDRKVPTVFDLIFDNRTDLFAVGRLDKDTTGILLITNDGELNHRVLSPKYHVEKTYIATIDGTLTDSDIKRLERGIDIGDDKPTLPAIVKVLDDDSMQDVSLTITEGRYHQVKRMFEAVGKPVIKLHRKSFGPIKLDEGLDKGEYRELTLDELNALKLAAGSED